MCTTCGCGSGEVRIEGVEPGAAFRSVDAAVPGMLGAHGWHTHADGTSHRHAHGPLGAVHAHGTLPGRVLQVEEDLLAANDAIAATTRERFLRDGVFAVNLMSSPGSGKTTLLVRTLELLGARWPVRVIEGDQQTSRDAERIRATGVPAVQINTGKGCHLDAAMVQQALAAVAPPRGSLMLIENVGNLVCPAAFDLGEARKVVILSVTEGDDKPLKYPDMFAAADLVVVSKIDLLPHVSFDVSQAIEHARRVRPGVEALCVSATAGTGMDAWMAWLARGVKHAAAGAEHAPVAAALQVPFSDLA